MKYLKRTLAVLLLLIPVIPAVIWNFMTFANYGFHRDVEEKERLLRQQVVTTAESWLGTQEGDKNHEKIINIYNSHTPLAQDYAVTLQDSWCAAYVSAVAIQCQITDIVPTECGCERQIGLWESLGCWEENDNYLPLPGDFIYYAWDEEISRGDCTGWADHVGIVVGTAGPFIKVIEGNMSDSVGYRTILRNNCQIRGYAIPDYQNK